MDLVKYLNQKEKTHIIFDFDYTLFRMVIPWEKWERKIEKDLRLLDQNIINDYKAGKINLSELQNLYVTRFGDSINKKIIAHNSWFETRHAQKFIPNKELLRLIPSLSKYNNFIWSSNTKYNLHKVLKKYGIYNIFKKIVTRNDVNLVKPYDDGFRLIHDEKTPIYKYLFVGDSGSDKQAAKNLKMDFHLINYFRTDTTSF